MEQFSQTTLVRQETQHKKPSKYDIIMYNDDVTTMEFVTIVLMEVFEYSREKAIEIMFCIHNSVSQVIGTYSKSVAEYKLECVEQYKKDWGYTEFRVEMRERTENA